MFLVLEKSHLETWHHYIFPLRRPLEAPRFGTPCCRWCMWTWSRQPPLMNNLQPLKCEWPSSLIVIWLIVPFVITWTKEGKVRAMRWGYLRRLLWDEKSKLLHFFEASGRLVFRPNPGCFRSDGGVLVQTRQRLEKTPEQRKSISENKCCNRAQSSEDSLSLPLSVCASSIIQQDNKNTLEGDQRIVQERYGFF